MQKSWRTWGWELFCFLIFFILVSYQIFLPPVTGLANNSDFSYVLGKLSICPADLDKQDNIYLVTDYFVDPVQCTYDIGLVSTEVPLTRAARRLSAPFTGKKNFDLRALAALHLAFLLFAFGVLLSITRQAGRAVRYGLPVLFIVIFSDVAYTCYLNSVYLDAPAFVLLLATTAIAAKAFLNHRSQWIAGAFWVFGAALIFSKSQHAILGLVFAASALVLALRPAKRMIRIEWVVIAALLAGSTVTMLSLTPNNYRLFALYNVIFGRLAPHSDAPWDVLKEVGLGDQDLKYLSSHAYVPGAPVYDKAWSEEFLHRTSFGKLMLFYVRNPDVAFSEMNRDLTHSAPVLRPTDMANYREKDGFPPRAMASRFSLWSNLRSALLKVFPYHVLLIYLAPWVVSIVAWKRPALRSPLLPLALALSFGGVVEFTMASLTDALDNSRHLFMFQVITELLILMIAAALLQLVDRWRPVTASAYETEPAAAPLRARVHLPTFRLASLLPAAGWWWEILCFLTLFGLVGYQLFLPPVTGLANNSDFLKVLGPWSICSDHQPQNNKSLVTDYVVDPACRYNLGITTLERPLVGVARYLSRVFEGKKRFDLRFLAALHLAILLLGFAILLRLTRRAPPLVRYGMPVLFMLIFSDVAYTCYLNSAYMDAPAFVLLIATTAIAIAACFNAGSWLVTAGYLIAGLALVFSKSQHAVLGVFFAAVALVFAFRSTTLWRIRWTAVALLLTGGMIIMLALTPSNYSLMAIYSVIFARLGPHSEAPLAMLKELGLGEQDLQYMNTNSYTPSAPIYTELWAEDFLRRTSFGDLIVYYLRHPSVPLREMDSDLRLAAPVMRPPEMPNFREQDGIPPGTMATRFSLWSNLRSAALRIFPYHVFLLYLAPWAAAFAAWKFKMERLRWPVIPLALALSAAGVLEFAMGTLTDALDTARHLFMFHVITELLILMIAAAVLSLCWDRVRSVHRASVIKSVACTLFNLVTFCC